MKGKEVFTRCRIDMDVQDTKGEDGCRIWKEDKMSVNVYSRKREEPHLEEM